MLNGGLVMEMIVEEISPEIQKINETIMTVYPSLDPRVTNNIYYTKLKYLLFNDIIKYCKEQIDLRQDLLNLRSQIGEYYTDEQLRDMFDAIKIKYNTGTNDTIGIDYHIESTRLDYGVCLFCVLKRGDIINIKKFIFRFRKGNLNSGVQGLNSVGLEIPDMKKDLRDLGGN